MRRLLYVLPLLVVAGLVLLFRGGLYRDPQLIPSAMIDKPAPSFALPALEPGKPGLATADLKGRVTLVSIFASWCVPCRVEHPLLMALAGKHLIHLVGIDYKDKPEDGRAWLASMGDPYDAIGIDEDGRAGIDFGVYGVPESYLIDRQGRIRYKQVGPFTPDTLDNGVLPMAAGLAK